MRGARCDNHRVRAVPSAIGLCLEEKHIMKRLFICTGLLLGAVSLFAQQKPAASPPAKESATIGGKQITITYSSPRVNGRAGHIFTPDGLIHSKEKHYPVWRAGANSATTLQTDADLTIGDLNVPAGTYTLFVDISDPSAWQLIVNKQTGEWGLAYDASQDLGKTKMTTTAPPSLVEDLKYTLVDNGGGKGSLTLAWENVTASVPVEAH
jgi:DUF2911 family protein